MAGKRIRRTTELPAEPETVWRCIVEPEYQKRWMIGLEENVPIEGHGDRAGDKFRMRIREGGKTRAYIGELLTYTPPNKLVLRMSPEDAPDEFVVVVSYELNRVPGGTSLDYTCDLEMKQAGCLMRLMAPIGYLFSRLLVRRILKNLKRVVTEVQAT